MTVVIPTDRPKSVRNRCVIEVFGGGFVLSIGFRILLVLVFLSKDYPFSLTILLDINPQFTMIM